MLPLQFWRRTCTVCLSRLLAASGHPCHSLVYRHITPISTFIFTWSPLYVSASKFPSSCKDPGPWIRACPNLVWPALTWITPTKTLPPNEITFSGTRGQEIQPLPSFTHLARWTPNTFPCLLSALPAPPYGSLDPWNHPELSCTRPLVLLVHQFGVPFLPLQTLPGDSLLFNLLFLISLRAHIPRKNHLGVCLGPVLLPLQGSVALEHSSPGTCPWYLEECLAGRASWPCDLCSH